MQYIYCMPISRHCANMRSYPTAEQFCLHYLCSLLVLHCIMVKIVKKEYCLFCCIVYVLCIHTPVNYVEQQVSQGKYDSGVGVDHVAVAHNEAEV